ncbi:MAG: glycosyltransferase family 39 protein, partial [Anaerolineales bacterium]
MKAPKSGSKALIFLILLWAVLILVGYYYTHKPISPPDAVALFNAVLQLLIAILMVIHAGGVGRQLLSLQDLAPLERVPLQAALGLGILALTWLLVGLLNLYTWWSAWGLLGLGLLVFRRKAWSWITDIATIKSTWDGSPGFGRSLALICGIFASIQLFYALAPPIKWDALMYHLDLPSRYLAAEGFVYIHSNPYWGNPQLAELLYTWGIGLGGLEVANLLGWAFISLLLVGILGTISRWVSPNAAWLAVATMLAGPSIRGLMSWAYVDGLAALFGFATLISTFYWIQKGHLRWLLWSGVFAGFAVFTKLTAAILLPALFLTVLIYHLFPSFFKKTSLPTIKAHDTPS